MEQKIGTWRARIEKTVTADRAGYITSQDAFKVGMAGVHLGAGRSKTTDPVLPHVGIEILAKPRTWVEQGQAVYRFWAESENQAQEAESLLQKSVEINQEPVTEPKHRAMIVEELHQL
jgi:pyrimidine-nucleoside phosphorylase